MLRSIAPLSVVLAALLLWPTAAARAIRAATPISEAVPSKLVLLHRPPGSSGATPVNFYIYRRSGGQNSNKLPLLFLMNGANVESVHYSKVARLLNQRGYTFVASDYYQVLPADLKKMLTDSGYNPPASCPADKILSPTAALLQTFLQYAATSNNTNIKGLANNGVVLISHSQGGLVSLEMLVQTCSQPKPAFQMNWDLCQGYQPPLRPSSLSTGGTCSAAPATARGILLGVVAYGGYRGGVTGPTGVDLPPGAFVLYLGGQYNNNTATAFDKTNTSACSCAGYARFPGLNHFGINNYQGNARHQVTPCARTARSDPPGFSVSSSRQAEALQQQAELIDRFIRGWVLREGGAGQALQQQAAAAAAGTGSPKLQLKGQCFKQ